MSWQDIILSSCSVIFVIALIPAVVRRQVPPVSTCITTAIPLTVIAGTYVTLNLFFSAITTAMTAGLWWRCVWEARRAC